MTPTPPKTFEDLGLSAELLKGLYSEDSSSACQDPERPPQLRTAIHRPGPQRLRQDHLFHRYASPWTRPRRLRHLHLPASRYPEQAGDGADGQAQHPIATGPEVDCVSGREKIVDQVVIGTPGKVLAWMREKQLNCSTMKILVFDEADQEGHRRPPRGLAQDETPRAAPSRCRRCCSSPPRSTSVPRISPKVAATSIRSSSPPTSCP